MKKVIILVLVCLMAVGFNSCIVTDGYVYDSTPSYIYYRPAYPRHHHHHHHHHHSGHHKPAPKPKPSPAPRPSQPSKPRPTSTSQQSRPTVHSGARPNSAVRR
jgi:hypothetical protein